MGYEPLFVKMCVNFSFFMMANPFTIATQQEPYICLGLGHAIFNCIIVFSHSFFFPIIVIIIMIFHGHIFLAIGNILPITKRHYKNVP